MERNRKKGSGSSVMLLFPLLRRLVFEAFDSQDLHLTRTQQIVLCAMADGSTFSMSELAKMIRTSNEQATRAVTQLVNMGYIERSQNEINHRVVNVRLTDAAVEQLKKTERTLMHSIAAGDGSDAALSGKDDRPSALSAELYTLLKSRGL